MKRSFTLIELLIVIVIIGVLASLAIPKYQNYVNYAKTIPKMANLLRAINTFHATTGYWPYTLDESGNQINGEDFGNIQTLAGWKSKKCGLWDTAGQYPNWTGPYVDNPDAFLDPWGTVIWWDGNPQWEPAPHGTSLVSLGPNKVDDGSWNSGFDYAVKKGDDVVLFQR